MGETLPIHIESWQCSGKVCLGLWFHVFQHSSLRWIRDRWTFSSCLCLHSPLPPLWIDHSLSSSFLSSIHSSIRKKQQRTDFLDHSLSSRLLCHPPRRKASSQRFEAPALSSSSPHAAPIIFSLRLFRDPGEETQHRNPLSGAKESGEEDPPDHLSSIHPSIHAVFRHQQRGRRDASLEGTPDRHGERCGGFGIHTLPEIRSPTAGLSVRCDSDTGDPGATPSTGGGWNGRSFPILSLHSFSCSLLSSSSFPCPLLTRIPPTYSPVLGHIHPKHRDRRG